MLRRRVIQNSQHIELKSKEFAFKYNTNIVSSTKKPYSYKYTAN